MVIPYIAATLVAALLLYVLRCRRQIWYGACEIVVAVVVIYLAFNPPHNFMMTNQGYSYVGERLEKFYGILAGIYIFVRGMDNICNGLPVTARARWDRVFF